MSAEEEATVIPIPRPRSIRGFQRPDGSFLPKKKPVPLPRKKLSSFNTEKDIEEIAVKMRKCTIRRESYRPIVIDRKRLDDILEYRPSSCPNIPESSSSTSFYDNVFEKMSARAIAASKSRGFGGERPLSAYDETVAEVGKDKRRASLAVMPLVELEYRDRILAESCAKNNDYREISPEFGAIRVQVEDITDGGAMSDEKVRSFDSNEMNETIRQEDLEEEEEEEAKNQSMSMTKVADWAVPSEYASSPIAQEIFRTVEEQRPRPPIPAIYMNTKAETDENSESTYSDFVVKRNSSVSSLPAAGKSVTLLEQIIRTHAIWYLPHLGRPEVLHLLQRMEPGNFIVRASTRENSMALSVRLSPGSHIDVDHYIIEKLAISLQTSVTTNVVRLEGSLRTFRSLPLLIEHYCVNDEELETRLKLPAAIRACTTTKQLQSIALMEQDFWISDMSLSRKPPARSVSRTSIVSNRTNENTLRKCHDAEQKSTWFMDEKIYDEVGNKYEVDEIPPHNGYYAVHDTLVPTNNKMYNNNCKSAGGDSASSTGLLTPDMSSSNSGSVKSNKKRRSASRASSSSSSRFATVCVGDIAYDRNPHYLEPTKIGDDETDSGLSSHSPPSKHDRFDNDVHISRTDRRSQSVRSHKSVNSPNTTPAAVSSHTIARSSRPRSFLRSLLSFGTSTKNQNVEKTSKVKENCDSTPRLANCEYFTPWNPSTVRTSRSAFDITSPPTRGFFAGNSPKKRNALKSSISIQNTANIFDDDNYTRGWKENSEMTADVKRSPTTNNSEAMKTFKPPSYDDVTSIRSRPMAMRRERSDLTGVSIGMIKNNAQRLAFHNESSPGPANIGSAGRVPMTPPTNANDPQIIKNCVEELRRKRLQSTNEMLTPSAETIGQQKQEARSAQASPQISMRRRNGFPSPSSNRQAGFAGIDRSHRLSVPNLIAVADPMIPGSVGQSAKALRERMGGRTTDGELTVINEGLVTPVVRRKHFATPKPDNNNRQSIMLDGQTIEKTNISGRVAEVEGVSVTAGEVSKRRDALEALIDRRKAQKQQQKPFDSMSSGSDQSSLERKLSGESELIWRRAKQQQQSLNKGRLAGGKTATTSAPSWSAINYELKNRQQKIAKVLPTPQTKQRTKEVNMMTVGEMSSIPSRRSSDYAQLCDFSASSADIQKGMHLDVHSKVDDDAVSVAGTVFNEPWDSNVWENLLDLAHHGDENAVGLKVSEPIQEEDSDSDRTAGGESSCQMDSDEENEDDVEEEENGNITWDSEMEKKRALPSDRVTVKGWEHDSDGMSAKYSTLDSKRQNGSIGGSLKRNPEGSFSMRSLPRALSRFSQGFGIMPAASFGSIDDLPTTIPSMSPLLNGRNSRGQQNGGVSPSTDEKIGKAVQEYVEQLAQVTDGDNACFGLTLKQFVACTKETKESDPAVVVRNVRQFINGMKNYLVKHGEGDLHRIIDEESSRLNCNQILNIDAVLEAVLHKLLLREVKPLLYHVMVKEHSKSGTLQLISSNIGNVRKMNLTQMGFSHSENLVVPSQQTMEHVKLLMRKMQSHYSPMKKLENLMKAVSMVVSCQNRVNEENSDPALQRGIPAADDLVRWLVYILARTSTVGCEVEAWYMWELLPQPILMQSDASYYLTALFSAVHVLKSAEAIRRLCEHDHQVISSIDMNRHCCSSPLLSTATLTRGAGAHISSISAAPCDAFVKIAVPDETVGCVRYATFPGVPLLTTSKLSRLVAHQQGITNPEEHGLYLISDGFESCLQPTDCPVMIHEQLKKENKPHLFAYKRHEAKIAWPRAAISAC